MQTEEHSALHACVHLQKQPSVYRITITFNSCSLLAVTIITRTLERSDSCLLAPPTPLPLPSSFSRSRSILFPLRIPVSRSRFSHFPVSPAFVPSSHTVSCSAQAQGSPAFVCHVIYAFVNLKGIHNNMRPVAPLYPRRFSSSFL